MAECAILVIYLMCLSALASNMAGCEAAEIGRLRAKFQSLGPGALTTSLDHGVLRPHTIRTPHGDGVH
jgi:hypothetical protein